MRGSAEQLLVILNDNGMSITPQRGRSGRPSARQRLCPQYRAFKKHYQNFLWRPPPGAGRHKVIHKIKQALKQSLLPCSMFENMGFRYLGPVDGHNLTELTDILRYAWDLNEPALLHVKTVKGKGFLPAEENPDAFHGFLP